MWLQVGDQLSDKQCEAFAQAMAMKLARTSWTDDESCEKLKLSFLSLSSKLKALVVHSMGISSHILDRVAMKWPPPMQHVRSFVCIFTHIAP